MPNKLFSLFEDKLRTPQDLVASTPQNLQSIGQQVEDPTAILRMIQQFEVVRPKADYSDFKNFVFFNSALDYFNLTGEKILNEFPYDRPSEEVQRYVAALDEYQRYVIDIWPSNIGQLVFNPSQGFAYVLVDDIYKNDGANGTSVLSPSTGSLSVEFWTVPPPALTGSNDVMVVVQKVTGSGGDGYTAYFSGSNIFFAMVSGSSTDQVSVPVNAGSASFFCFSYDRGSSPAILRAFSGSTTRFPVQVTGLTSSLGSSVNAGTSRLSIASGSGGGTKVVRPLTGSLDDVRVWSSARDLSSLTSSFNTRVLSQEGLTALWRFNETGSLPIGQRERVFDAGGNRLDGRIQGYYSALRGSGSIIPFDEPDLVLSQDEPAVSTYIATQQLSGTIYDRFNDNNILRMMPEQFFLLEEFKETTVLQDFLYVVARYFDNLKVMIDQFAHVRRNTYQTTNVTPDALLQDIGKFFGWEFTGAFLNNDAIQYILGKQVLPNLDTNRIIDTKLFEIKNEFWKRTLVNLMHLYKTKGTRESVESLLRIYGANTNFIRLKEYGYKPNAGIQTFRIPAEKSKYAVTFGSGTTHDTRILSPSVSTTPHITSSGMSTEFRVCFPLQTSTGLIPTIATGSIWTMFAPNFTGSAATSGSAWQRLSYMKNGVNSTTGSLKYQHWTLDAVGAHVEYDVQIDNLPIFDESWVDIAVIRSFASSSLTIDVRRLDQDTVTLHTTGTRLNSNVVTSSIDVRAHLGSTTTFGTGSEFWGQEFRVWNRTLSDNELQDHTLNFQSFGEDAVYQPTDLAVHWRLDQNLTADSGGSINSYFDFSRNGMNGTGSNFAASLSPSKKFLFDYNYIASPEYGWNEQKIRSFNSPYVKPEDAFQDNPMVGLEFNLTDALNEDISQIISTLDSFNNSVGAPVNAFRESYHDLSVLRRAYFQRLRGSINFRVFADLLEFFDQSFIDLVKKLIPARATFLGDEFVVESHILERPKVQWNYRRRDQTFEPEGVITVYIRT